MGLRVLSLFDGISCGRLALRDAGLCVDAYYASEINPSAIKVARSNWPETVHLGDVCSLDSTQLGTIDLLIGGSPCQSLSNAGRGAGFDGKSGLFYEYVRHLRAVRPRWFLLENVVMRQEWQDVISDILGVQPVLINSASFVPHNRPRLYWTNIPLTPHPTVLCDMGLADILEDSVDPSYFLTDVQLSKLDLDFKWSSSKSSRIRRHKGGKHQQDSIQHHSGHSGCLAASHHGAARHLTKTLLPDGRIRRLTEVECERLQSVPKDYTACISSSARYEALGNGWTVSVISWILGHLRNCHEV